MTSVTEPTTSTLAVPGAILTYDVRASEESSLPALLIIGSYVHDFDALRAASTGS